MERIIRTCIILTVLLTPCIYAEVPVEMLSHIGGYHSWFDPSIAWSVAVDGNLACVGMANCVLLLDISQLSAPAQLARIDFEVGEVTGADIQGDILYTASNYGLHIIDVSNQTDPQILSSLSTDTGCAVVVSGDYAYLADGEECLRIIDVSNPNEPNIVGSWKPDSPEVFAEHIDLQDGIAYVSDEHYKKLYIIDVSEPNSPTELSTYESEYYTHGICVRGDYAYLANSESGLNIIDISNPNEPNSIAVCDTPGNAYGVAIVEIPHWPGGPIELYTCVIDAWGELHIIWVTWPETPVLMYSHPTGAYSRIVDAQDSYAFVTNSQTGIDIIHIEQYSGYPTLVGRFATSQAARHVSIVGNIACLTDEYKGLNLFDISNPAAPACFGGFDPFITNPYEIDYPYSQAATVKDDKAFLATFGGEIRIIEFSNPFRDQQEMGNHPSSEPMHDMVVDSNILFITDESDGLASFDALHPYLDWKDTVNTSGVSRGLDIDSNIACVADGLAGMVVIDVNNPDALSLMGSCDTNGSAYGVDIFGSHAVVADYNDGLKTIDISDPCNPVQVGSCPTVDLAADVTVAGSLAFIADGNSGIQIAAISDPCTPQIVGSLDFEGFAKKIDNNGKIAAIAADEGGFYIVRIGEPADLEPDGDIDGDDFTILMQQWMNPCEKPYGCSNADINNDTIVNFTDFAELAAKLQ